MATFTEVMGKLIKKHGDNKTLISNKLGLKEDGKPKYSSQLLGQYESGEIKSAKGEFYSIWKDKMGDDIESLMEYSLSELSIYCINNQSEGIQKPIPDREWYQATIGKLIDVNEDRELWMRRVIDDLIKK